MHRSYRSLVRFRDVFRWGKSGAAPSAADHEIPPDHVDITQRDDDLRELMSRMSVEQRRKHSHSEHGKVDQEELEELDEIAARGFMKFKRYYNPLPVKDLEEAFQKGIAEMDSKALKSIPEDWRSISLKDPYLKFHLLNQLAVRLDHSVPNSRLHEMKTCGDLFEFYQEPVKNITPYAELARKSDLPPNLHINEHPVRFDPEDTESYHGGVTAFPGLDGQEQECSNQYTYKFFSILMTTEPRNIWVQGVYVWRIKLLGTDGHKNTVKIANLRYRRLYKSFKAKTKWHHYQDKHYDYTATPENAPWARDTSLRLDKNLYDRRQYD